MKESCNDQEYQNEYPNFNAMSSFPTNIYLRKVNNTNTRKRCKICSKLRIKTPEQR